MLEEAEEDESAMEAASATQQDPRYVRYHFEALLKKGRIVAKFKGMDHWLVECDSLELDMRFRDSTMYIKADLLGMTIDDEMNPCPELRRIIRRTGDTGEDDPSFLICEYDSLSESEVTDYTIRTTFNGLELVYNRMWHVWSFFQLPDLTLQQWAEILAGKFGQSPLPVFHNTHVCS